MSAIHYDGTAEAWHALRAKHIGGSDVASLFHVWHLSDGSEPITHLFERPDDPAALPLCSLSPYKTGYRLWLERRAGVEADDLDEVERIRMGTFMEPAIAGAAKDKWGWGIRKVRRYLQHATVPGWGASLDYEVHEAGAAGAPVEIKNVDYLVFRDKWQVDGDEIVGVPLHINLQSQSQIGAAGTDHGWVVAAVGGNKLYRGRIERHEPTQQMIAEAIEAFWSSAAAPEWLADSETAKDIYASGVKDALADMTGDAAAAALARRYARWKRHLDFTTKIADGLKGRLQIRMGEKTKARGDGFTITWPAVHREEKAIPAKIQPPLDYRGGFTLKETM
ncbi:hypothetical protein KL86PLE_100300 [uncultured Pleomorphomonas sp.]|uniref:YqaJ viral recombinase domain-containing protein n=1 Tax=uncultured Pleomorphomonas sp. TaxID=442121 RepID=A0A212L2A5_9HYPH|nr:YqaJ viral recombinase family protein [uncultured Pleomorphomonas sp.]SCM71658.1 hypothetical protein KL86PLE_100300 [uncultured Pleomorphomonas sp.]